MSSAVGSAGAKGPILLQQREGAVLVLTHNNPAVRNALSPEFYAALTAALRVASRMDL